MSVTGDPVFGTMPGVPGPEGVDHRNSRSPAAWNRMRLARAADGFFVPASIRFAAPSHVSGLLQVSGDLTDASGMPIESSFFAAELEAMPEPSTMILAALPPIVITIAGRRRRAVRNS